MRELLIATTNHDKLRELREGLGELPFHFLTLTDFPDVSEANETASTLEGNAIIKAFTYGKRTGKLTLAEDTGLEVEALEGRPGVQSARYAETPEARNTKLLSELAGVSGDKRSAQFRTVFAIYDPENDRVLTGEGKVEGRISESIRGETWGYGTLFEIAELGKTFGEISEEQKNVYSHRALAAHKAAEALKSFI